MKYHAILSHSALLHPISSVKKKKTKTFLIRHIAFQYEVSLLLIFLGRKNRAYSLWWGRDMYTFCWGSFIPCIGEKWSTNKEITYNLMEAIYIRCSLSIWVADYIIILQFKQWVEILQSRYSKFGISPLNKKGVESD